MRINICLSPKTVSVFIIRTQLTVCVWKYEPSPNVYSRARQQHAAVPELPFPIDAMHR
jgi:hypothetical protein